MPSAGIAVASAVRGAADARPRVRGGERCGGALPAGVAVGVAGLRGEAGGFAVAGGGARLLAFELVHGGEGAEHGRGERGRTRFHREVPRLVEPLARAGRVAEIHAQLAE